MLEDYDITSKLGYVMSDNATFNDTMMIELSRRFMKLGSEIKPYDSVKKRLHCNGHVINLSVIAFFFDKHSNADAI